jgi:hypothetical protein
VAPEDWNSMISLERYLQIVFERRQIKSLQGHFKAPKKLKSSGKISSKKKKSGSNPSGKKNTSKSASAGKPNGGKADKRRAGKAVKILDGFAPVKKKSDT